MTVSTGDQRRLLDTFASSTPFLVTVIMSFIFKSTAALQIRWDKRLLFCTFAGSNPHTSSFIKQAYSTIIYHPVPSGLKNPLLVPVPSALQCLESLLKVCLEIFERFQADAHPHEPLIDACIGHHAPLNQGLNAT